MGQSKDQTKTENDTTQWTRSLLVGAGSAFAAGVFGTLWYTNRRKHAQYLHQTQKPFQQQPSHLGVLNPKQHPKMTPAEYEVAKRKARFFALKSLGYGTLLALTGAGVVATAIGYWLDVRNFQEFSDQLHTLIPQRTARLRHYLGGKDLEMTAAEEEEMEDILQEIVIDE